MVCTIITLTGLWLTWNDIILDTVYKSLSSLLKCYKACMIMLLFNFLNGNKIEYIDDVKDWKQWPPLSISCNMLNVLFMLHPSLLCACNVMCSTSVEDITCSQLTMSSADFIVSVLSVWKLVLIRWFNLPPPTTILLPCKLQFLGSIFYSFRT